MPASDVPVAARARRRRLWAGLGLLSAVGGLVDVGNLVANPQAGARYGLALVPVVIVSGCFVALYGEMAGRVAAVSGTAGFEIVRAVLPRPAARVNLAACGLVTAMTCAAEVGGMARLAGDASGTSARLWALPVAVALALVIWRWSFRGAERALGLAGLTMLVVVVAVLISHPHWGGLAQSATHVPGRPASFAYLAVAQVGSMLVPYQLVFFSSGAREEGWDRAAMTELRVNVWSGYGVGTMLAVALVVLGAVVYLPRHVSVDHLHQVVVLPGLAGLGHGAEVVMGVAMVAAMAGAAFETALATGYMAAQYRGWTWSMDDPVWRSASFFAVTIGTLLLAGAVMTAGIDVVSLTDWSLVLSTVALPLTYAPVWMAARDRRRMGEHRSGALSAAAGAVSLGVVVAVALVAVPALVLGR